MKLSGFPSSPTTRALAAMAMVIAVGTTLLFGSTFLNIFQVFPDDDGRLQSTHHVESLNGSNKFFDPGFGTNGQSCSTCHLAQDGFTIHVQTIQDTFNASDGLDPLFRLNDSANRPDADVSSTAARQQAYSVALALGDFRIGEVLPKNAEFVVADQYTDTFGQLPSTTDPQHPGVATLSLFRRPLVPTNMRFDSAVLWDGRASITNIRAQVTGAAKTLLLNPSPAVADADEVAQFQLGMFTDQVFDGRDSFPPSHAHSLSAQGAKGGVFNMLVRSTADNAPCIYDVNPTTGKLERTNSQFPQVTYYPSQGSTVLTPKYCTPVVQGGPNMTTYKAWLHLKGSDEQTVSRLRIAHGEEIFNTATMHVPSDIVIPGVKPGAVAHCTTCHATNNTGNHPRADFFVRLGSDSVSILQELADAQTDPAIKATLQDFVTRTAMLPQYCLRSTAAGAPSLFTMACGSYGGDATLGIPADLITSDPGRAMVTGKWVDIGKFKPPILRNLPVRSPYFHGSAADSTVSLVEFYNARFNMGLTQAQKDDLVRFVEAH